MTVEAESLSVSTLEHLIYCLMSVETLVGISTPRLSAELGLTSQKYMVEEVQSSTSRM